MRIRPSWLVILLLGSVSLCSAQQPSDFSGTWVLKLNGQAILKLTLASEKGSITGSLTKPRQLTFDQDGDLEKISPDEVTLPVQKAAFNGRQLELTVDDDHFVLTTEDPSHILLVLEEVFRWLGSPHNYAAFQRLARLTGHEFV